MKTLLKYELPGGKKLHSSNIKYSENTSSTDIFWRQSVMA